MPHSSNRMRMGTKCRTRLATNSNKAASQLSSGTEKLNVLHEVRLKNVYDYLKHILSTRKIKHTFGHSRSTMPNNRWHSAPFVTLPEWRADVL